MIISTVTGKSGYEKDGTASTSQGSHWQSFDAGVASQTFCLAAHSLGLATVIMGIFDEEKIPKRKAVDELLRIMN